MSDNFSSILLSIPNDLLKIVISLLTTSSRYLLFRLSRRLYKYKVIYNKIDFTLYEGRSLTWKEQRYLIIIDTISNGHTDLLKFFIPDIFDLYKVYTRMEARYFREKAAETGRIEILEYICQFMSYNETDHGLLPAAAEGGQLATIKWLRSKKCPWDTKACSGAAKNGHFEILKYLHENKCPIDYSAYETAIKNGDLDIVKFLYENDCVHIDNDGATIAFKTGQMDILKWLIDHGQPFNEKLCFKFGSSIHDEDVSMLKWGFSRQ